MSKKYSIAVDAMGGDNAPEKVLEGLDLFLKQNKNVNINLYGNETDIHKLIINYKMNKHQLQIRKDLEKPKSLSQITIGRIK